MRLARVLCLMVLLHAAYQVRGEAAGGCTLPSGFTDIAHPVPAPAEQLVSHTEEVVIARPLARVAEVMSRPLNQALRKSSSLPGVAGDFALTKGPFGAPGSRRIVCLSDGGFVEEEVLEKENAPASSRFRYIVWNYHTPKAKPIAYGVGEFRSIQIDSSHTQVTWTYSFRLKENVFPGYLGCLGRFLFRAYFLDREYAAMMRTVLNGYKLDSEARSD